MSSGMISALKPALPLGAQMVLAGNADLSAGTGGYRFINRVVLVEQYQKAADVQQCPDLIADSSKGHQAIDFSQAAHCAQNDFQAVATDMGECREIEYQLACTIVKSSGKQLLKFSRYRLADIASGLNDDGLVTGLDMQAHVGQCPQVVHGLYPRQFKSSDAILFIRRRAGGDLVGEGCAVPDKEHPTLHQPQTFVDSFAGCGIH